MVLIALSVVWTQMKPVPEAYGPLFILTALTARYVLTTIYTFAFSIPHYHEFIFSPYLHWFTRLIAILPSVYTLRHLSNFESPWGKRLWCCNLSRASSYLIEEKYIGVESLLHVVLDVIKGWIRPDTETNKDTEVMGSMKCHGSSVPMKTIVKKESLWLY
jgi:hypothetical protein